MIWHRMGLCGSGLSEEYDKIVKKDIAKARPVLGFLGIETSSKAARQLHEAFDKAVINSNGDADVKKLLHCLQLPYRKFYFENFLCFENHASKDVHGDNHQVCNFSQYIVGLWNLCTMSVPKGLADWTFKMEWGEDPVTVEDVFELFDKQYGISEERDFNANIGKAWYGEDFHKHNVQRTMAKIRRWVNADDGMMHPKGFLHFVLKVPGILQGQISARRTLRDNICGEHFWRKQDAKRKKDADLQTIYTLVSALELLNPGCVINNGDGLTSIHGVRNDNVELSDDARTVLKVRAAAESATDNDTTYLHHKHSENHKHHEHFNPYKNHHAVKPHRNTEHRDKPINHAAHQGHTTGGGHSAAHKEVHHSHHHHSH